MYRGHVSQVGVDARVIGAASGAAGTWETCPELTMNDKEIGGRIETTDDVQGHSASGRFIDGPDTDDIEGHSASGRFIDGPGTEDVEGHRFSGGLVADDTDDDTQGHGTRAGV